MEFPTERELREVGILIAQNIIDTASLIAEGKLLHLLERAQPKWKDPNNRTLGIDEHGRNVALRELALNFQDRVKVYGEEEKNTPGKRFAELNKVVAVIDPVDGTDLLARDFSNWVSAMIFFIPKQRKILCAVVGHASGDIYYASEKGAFVRPRFVEGKRNRDRKLKREAKKDVPLCEASVCFYGQKPKSFLAIAQHKNFVGAMEQFQRRMTAPGKKKEELGVRIYNFGGNPMMVKIPSGAVDAVFSLGSTELHDVMPGAYIAHRAGAVLTDLNGNDIDPVTALVENKPLRYILSGSRKLATELKDLLSPTA